MNPTIGTKILMVTVLVAVITSYGLSWYDRQLGYAYKRGQDDVTQRVEAEAKRDADEKAAIGRERTAAAEKGKQQLAIDLEEKEKALEAQKAVDAGRRDLIARLRATVSPAGSGQVRADPQSACGADVARANRLAAALREGQALLAEGAGLLDEVAVMVGDHADLAHLHEALIRAGQNWATAVMIGADR